MATNRTPAKNTNSVDQSIEKQKTTSIDQTARDADRESKTRKPGESSGRHNERHNNGRGGGK